MEADGFLPARTYVEWGEVAVVPTRARLVVRREGDAVKVQNALGAPLQLGYLQLGGKLLRGARARRWRRGRGPRGVSSVNGSAKEQRAAQERTVEDVVGAPVVKRRWRRSAGLPRPLREGGFVARLGGAGFGPLAGMKVELHEGVHYVRGQVDTP